MSTIAKALQLLGIETVSEEKELYKLSHDIIRQGLSIDSLKQLANYYKMPEAQIASLLGTSERTLDRLQKEDKPLNATRSDRLYRLARVAARAIQVFENEETARKWLKRPNRALAGVAPIELLDTDAGTEEIVDLLNRIEYGVYS